MQEGRFAKPLRRKLLNMSANNRCPVILQALSGEAAPRLVVTIPVLAEVGLNSRNVTGAPNMPMIVPR